MAQVEAAKRTVRENEVRRDEAQVTLKRLAQLVKDGFATQAEADAAKATIDSNDARIFLVREQVKVAEQQVVLEQTNLDNTIIRAPFSGVAISKDAQPGEMVSPVSAGGGFTRTGICTIVDMRSLEIEVDVNESYINRVKPDQGVTAVLDAYQDWQIPAHVITMVPDRRPPEGDRARAHRLRETGSADPAGHGREGHVPARRGGHASGDAAAGDARAEGGDQDGGHANGGVRRRQRRRRAACCQNRRRRWRPARSAGRAQCGRYRRRQPAGDIGGGDAGDCEVTHGSGGSGVPGFRGFSTRGERTRTENLTSNPRNPGTLGTPEPCSGVQELLMSTETLVQVRDVHKHFTRGGERIEVLKGVNLDIPQGDFLALMGPSGSGKTTLLNLMGGLDEPTNGTLTIAGERVDDLSGGELSRWRARNIGFVFQLYNLLPVLTAERNVELPLLLTKLSKADRRKRVAIALKVVGPGRTIEALSAAALRRSGAARRHRARHRHRPDAAALRRADRRSRPQGRRRDPRPAPGAQPRPRQDHRDGHARSARGRSREAHAASRQGPAHQRRRTRVKYLSLVWKNLWRRKIRTTFTLLSIFIAFLLFGLLMTIRMAFTFGVEVAGADRLVLIHKVSLIMPLPIVVSAAAPGRARR